MPVEIKMKVSFPLQWEYGFGIYGLGTYLHLWDDVILFIKETEK